MICGSCGREYKTVWRVEDELWERVHAGYSMLCTSCFQELAELKGIYLHWGAKPERYPLDTEILALETVTISAAECLRRVRTCRDHLEEALHGL